MKGAAAAALACLSLAGCSQGAPALRAVVLISIDTLRADHLGLYGYPRPTSPVLDALGAEGVVFEDVTAASPWTLPSHASLLTGLYPSRHGVRAENRKLPAEVASLAELLARAGWDTAAVVNSRFLGHRHGLSRGFESFVYDASVEERTDSVEPTRAVTDRALAWLRAPRDAPLFLFVHYYDVHSDYRSLPEYERAFVSPYAGPMDGSTARLQAVERGDIALDERDVAHLIDLYDAGIRQMDAEIGRLVDALRGSGRLSETLLVLTSDHGEEFLEHGRVLHGATHFREVMRVPLILRGPGIPAGRRVSTPVSHVDVTPTLLSVLGVAAPESLDGIDLSPAWREGGRAFPERALFGEADNKNVEYDAIRSVRLGRFVLHIDRARGRHALFDLESDPGERVDVATRRPEITRRLLERAQRFATRGGQRRPETTFELTPEETEKLRNLGYLGGSPDRPPR